MTQKKKPLYEAWGEEKTLSEWAKDPRVVCQRYSVLEYRLRSGWTTARAFETPPRVHVPTFSEAFGERKNLREWADDPRCLVPYGTLYTRVRDQQWNTEAALTTPSHDRRGKRKEGDDR